MANRADRDLNVVRPDTASPAPVLARRTNALPRLLKFPLLCILSLTLSAGLYTLAEEWTGGELAAVSKKMTEPWQVGVVFGWRLLEIGVSWWGGLDYLDLISLTLLSHFPYLHLLNTFFLVSPTTVLITLAIDVVSLAVPLRLLRATLPAHNPRASKRIVPDRDIIHDSSIGFLTTLFPTAIISLLLYVAERTFLPTFAVQNFADIPSVAAAHGATLPSLLTSLIPAGWAAREFLFMPSSGATPSPVRNLPTEPQPFNPAMATLSDTIWYNLGLANPSPRVRILAKRTGLLSAVVFANTAIKVWTVEGAETVGVLGWAGLWTVVQLVLGSAFAWLGAV
ncbi:hypothetical protein M501DRAFT_1027274 [Patellaria atrata CBS 101060]|uniref:Uncharacterized protein n=1 Tax=Patellaria atrata CBS 101060 TaxID=1346257 RepID=A0A9P4S3N2_9PEZI|nr:hypothetical protein M501DRAFT_1027274 [Patellaria atrata CBS 101060]